MKITGSNTLPAPVAQVWEALLDPRVLVATIPGCERLVGAGDHTYDMTVTAGVAAIKGTYQGACSFTDLEEHESLVLRLSGAGAPGTIEATVRVYFGEAEPGVTKVDYDADATVGGMVGGVGQRMLTSVSKRMATEFFGNVATSLAEQDGATTAGAATTGADEPGAMPMVYTDQARPGVAPSRDDFLRGAAVGAGLVLLGVAAGSVLGRRR